MLSGKYFCGVGLCRDGIFLEAGGRQIVRKGKYKKVWLRVDIDAERNEHQFWYSIDGKHYEQAGHAFTLKGGYWKGIRTGLFCYGEDGQAQFDYYRVK
jgi:beta-xylosidase